MESDSLPEVLLCEEVLPAPVEEVDLALFVSLVLDSFLAPKIDFAFVVEDDLEPEALLVSLLEEEELEGELDPELPVLLPVSEELPSADEEDALGELDELPEVAEPPELDEPPERFEDSFEF